MQTPHGACSERFGAAMHKVRQRARWTQAELAARAGLSLTYVGELERGQRSPSLLTISRIAKAARMTGAKLLEEAGL